jgi:hypothetical protein
VAKVGGGGTEFTGQWREVATAGGGQWGNVRSTEERK